METLVYLTKDRKQLDVICKAVENDDSEIHLRADAVLAFKPNHYREGAYRRDTRNVRIVACNHRMPKNLPWWLRIMRRPTLYGFYVIIVRLSDDGAMEIINSSLPDGKEAVESVEEFLRRKNEPND